MSRVLVVEDYPPLATVITIGVHRMGHEVVRVGSLARALATEGVFACAILDIDLPDGSGVDLARELTDAGRVQTVIFYSATRDASLREQALRSGRIVDKTEGLDPLLTVLEEELAGQALQKVIGAPDQPAVAAKSRSGTRRRVR